ncbi:hypothetical protein EDB83DRAFT_2310680 [Lactarius deliciosus]|nr:hypothetical protein EDB83DRAFT_2310680 [Lactarius deliciosus]
MPAQGVARTVDPRTGLRSYSTSAYFDAEAHHWRRPRSWALGTGRLGIPVGGVLDLPEVGENLQDHLVTLSDFKLKPGITTLDLAARTLTALQTAQYQHLKDLVDGGEEGWVEIIVVPSGEHIDNTNIQDQPIIDLRIDDLRWDFDILYYGTKFLKWIQTKPLADLIDEWITPLASLQDAEWEKFVTSVRVRLCSSRRGTQTNRDGTARS